MVALETGANSAKSRVKGHYPSAVREWRISEERAVELLAAWEREAESRGLDRYGVTFWPDGEAWLKERNPGSAQRYCPAEPAVLRRRYLRRSSGIDGNGLDRGGRTSSALFRARPWSGGRGRSTPDVTTAARPVRVGDARRLDAQRSNRQASRS